MVHIGSKDDFRNRTKASKTVVDYMADLGLFRRPSGVQSVVII